MGILVCDLCCSSRLSSGSRRSCRRPGRESQTFFLQHNFGDTHTHTQQQQHLIAHVSHFILPRAATLGSRQLNKYGTVQRRLWLLLWALHVSKYDREPYMACTSSDVLVEGAFSTVVFSPGIGQKLSVRIKSCMMSCEIV